MSRSAAGRAIDVYELARRGVVVEGQVPVAVMPRLRASLRSGAGAIDFRLQGLIDAQERPAARLHLEADLALTCDRCGQPINLPLRHDAAFYFVNSESELAALPVVAEDEAEPLLGSDSFDLATLIEDETILSLPISPRHTECAGRARGESSEAGELTTPFAGLRGLLRGNEH